MHSKPNAYIFDLKDKKLSYMEERLLNDFPTFPTDLVLSVSIACCLAVIAALVGRC
jgi:hypothetical protein